LGSLAPALLPPLAAPATHTLSLRDALPISAWRISRRAAVIRSSSGPGGHFRFEVLDNRLEELLGRHPRLVGADQQREILGHLAALDRVDADLLERFGKANDVRRVVEPAAVDEATGPGEDAGDRVGAGRLALLVLAIVARDRAVRRFGLDRLAVRGHQHAGHQAQRAEALRDLIRLDVAVVVLGGPDELAVPFEGAGDNVVDQAVLVLDP